MFLLHYCISPLLHFEIVDETDDYVVVNKPPFLLIHPTKRNGAPTLWKQLRELLAFEVASGGQVSIVNRLDRETGGLGQQAGFGEWRPGTFELARLCDLAAETKPGFLAGFADRRIRQRFRA